MKTLSCSTTPCGHVPFVGSTLASRTMSSLPARSTGKSGLSGLTRRLNARIVSWAYRSPPSLIWPWGVVREIVNTEMPSHIPETCTFTRQMSVGRQGGSVLPRGGSCLQRRAYHTHTRAHAWLVPGAREPMTGRTIVTPMRMTQSHLPLTMSESGNPRC